MTDNNATPPAATPPVEGTPPAATPPAEATPPAATSPAATPPAEATPPAAKTDEWQPYELAAPEGAQVDAGQLKDFTAFANELKIPKDKAEAFSKQFVQKQTEAVQAQIAAWRAETEADKEIGGPNYAQNVGIAKKALKKFGGDEVLQVLEETGLGNHKAIIRTFLQVGKAMSDDVVITQGGGVPKQEPTFAGALMSVANSKTKEK